jgi:hypothetical protein
MRQTLAATSWLVACAFLMSAAAQTPQPSTAQQPPPVQAADEKSVTLTGCLASGDESNTFKLTDIRSADKTAARPGEMVGTTGVKTGGVVQLIGTDAAKLQGHLGHTVAVTGELVPQKTGEAATPATPTQPPSTEQEKAEMRLNVTSFKHVDATCPPADK